MKTISVESQQDSLEIEFVLSWEDREKAETIYRSTLRAKKGRGIYRPALFTVSIMLIALGLWLGIVPGEAVSSREIALAVTALACLVFMIGDWWLRRLDFRANGQARNRHRLKQRWTASKDLLECMQGSCRTIVPWSAIRRVARIGANLAIFVDEVDYFLIPDRAFVTESQKLRFFRMFRASKSS